MPFERLRSTEALKGLASQAVVIQACVASTGPRVASAAHEQGISLVVKLSGAADRIDTPSELGTGRVVSLEGHGVVEVKVLGAGVLLDVCALHRQRALHAGDLLHRVARHGHVDPGLQAGLARRHVVLAVPRDLHGKVVLWLVFVAYQAGPARTCGADEGEGGFASRGADRGCVVFLAVDEGVALVLDDVLLDDGAGLLAGFGLDFPVCCKVHVSYFPGSQVNSV